MSHSKYYSVQRLMMALIFVSLIALLVPPLTPDSTGQTTIYQENAFLKIGNIKGRAQTQGYQEQIVFKEMSYQVTQQAKWEQANSRITVFGDVKISKDMDASSPALALACASKEQIPSAVISLVSGKDLYLKVTLEGVIVSSVSVGFISGAARPGETITLSYQKATWEWGTSKAGYDLRQNSKV